LAKSGASRLCKHLVFLSNNALIYSQLQQSPEVNILVHARIFTLMVIMLMLDASFIAYTAYYTISINGPSMMLLFGFEVKYSSFLD
jgi:hypothetical protein